MLYCCGVLWENALSFILFFALFSFLFAFLLFSFFPFCLDDTASFWPCVPAFHRHFFCFAPFVVFALICHGSFELLDFPPFSLSFQRQGSRFQRQRKKSVHPFPFFLEILTCACLCDFVFAGDGCSGGGELVNTQCSFSHFFQPHFHPFCPSYFLMLPRSPMGVCGRGVEFRRKPEKNRSSNCHKSSQKKKVRCTLVVTLPYAESECSMPC